MKKLFQKLKKFFAKIADSLSAFRSRLKASFSKKSEDSKAENTEEKNKQKPASRALAFFWELRNKNPRKFRLWGVITVISILVYIAAFFATGKIIQNYLEIPRGGILAVDQNSSSKIENGSLEHPFRTITAALEFARENPAFGIILIYSGQYEEQLTLPNGINLIGQGDLVIQGSKDQPTILVEENAGLFNLRIYKGESTIWVGESADVLIFNCEIGKAEKFGIYSEKSPKNLKQNRIAIVKTRVTENERQGLYLQRGELYLNNSEIVRNKEEGIDLHSGTNAVIQNSRVSYNHEGGIEIDIKEMYVIIDNCEIKDNQASGINLQTQGQNSKIVIKNNHLESNVDYGIRCAIHSGFKRNYFQNLVDIENSNSFAQNGKGGISQDTCFNR